MRKFFFSILAFFCLAAPVFADTLTVYPDAGTGNTTVDGYAGRQFVDETFATIIAGAGNTSNDTVTNSRIMYLRTSTTSDQFAYLYRGIFTFDTSALTADATISAATFSVYGSNKGNQHGSMDLVVVAATPASDNAIIDADYSTLGSTVFGTIAYASLSTSAYNNVTLDANGQANISKTGISKFATTSNWDATSTYGGSWVSDSFNFLNGYYADQSGTSLDPKLTVTYTTVGRRIINVQ